MFADGSWVAKPEPMPWVKDYDALDDAIHLLPDRHLLDLWLGLVALCDGRIVGTLLAVADDPTYVLPQGADGVWVVDVRVAPSVQGTGVGRALWSAAEAWAIERGRHTVWVETQDVNVPACRFYRAMGCQAVAVDSDAYPPELGETRVLWMKRLETNSILTMESQAL